MWYNLPDDETMFLKLVEGWINKHTYYSLKLYVLVV
jgi:hypothetical protein